jgi:hypothetical protein
VQHRACRARAHKYAHTRTGVRIAWQTRAVERCGRALVCGAAGFKRRTPPAPLPCVPTRSLSMIYVPPRRRVAVAARYSLASRACAYTPRAVSVAAAGAARHTAAARRRRQHKRTAGAVRVRVPRARACALGTREARRWCACVAARRARRTPWPGPWPRQLRLNSQV